MQWKWSGVALFQNLREKYTKEKKMCQTPENTKEKQRNEKEEQRNILRI